MLLEQRLVLGGWERIHDRCESRVYSQKSVTAARELAGQHPDGRLDPVEGRPAGLVLAAGFETTVNLLGNGIALLHSNPEQLERLRNEPDLWPNAVDEVLRLDPPVLFTGRFTERGSEVAGKDIRPGFGVLTVLAGANRDPEVFPDPTAFDVARPNARDHLSFGFGIHYCLGNMLAKLQAKIALEELAAALPNLELVDGGAITFRKNLSFRVPDFVNVEVNADSTSRSEA